MPHMKLHNRHKAFLCVLCGISFLLFGCPDETLPSRDMGYPCENDTARSRAARKVESSNGVPGEPALAWVTRFKTESPPTVDGGILFAISDEDRLYALDGVTGDLIWCHQVNSAVYSPLVAANGVIYFHALDGYLYGFDAQTGKKLLRTWAALGDAFEPSLTVVDDVIYNITGIGIRLVAAKPQMVGRSGRPCGM